MPTLKFLVNNRKLKFSRFKHVTDKDPYVLDDKARVLCSYYQILIGDTIDTANLRYFIFLNA